MRIPWKKTTSPRPENRMPGWARLTVGLALALAFGMAAWAGLRRTVTAQVDGTAISGSVYAVTVEQALAGLGIAAAPGDRVTPRLDAWLVWLPGNPAVIRVDRAWPVRVVDTTGGQTTRVLAARITARTLAEMLGAAGVRLQPGDRVLENGLDVPPDQALPAGAHVLQIVRAVDVTVLEDGRETALRSTAAAVGQALWQAGYRFAPEDWVSPGLETALGAGAQVQVRRARVYTVQAGARQVEIRSAALRTGDVLADGGLALQGLDYAVPDGGAPVPAGGRIRVVRVQEAAALTETEIPFETEWQADGSVELDQRSVIHPGQSGLTVHRERVRYEDGKEVSRTAEGDWQARAPQNKVIGYGTKVVIRTLQTADGPVEYWRAVTMYATSYSPCTQGYDHCSWSTASGTLLQKGVIGVKVAWYRLMAGLRLYVPGYGVGTIADSGGAVPGKYHIDLGYGKDDFINWHDWVTVYFLTPVPADIPWILP